jgi:hypothetical protein
MSGFSNSYSGGPAVSDFYLGSAPGGTPTQSETTPRRSVTSFAIPIGTTGQLFLAAVALQQGQIIKNIGYVTGTSGATAPTAQWSGLFSASGQLLCNTGNQGATAIASTTGYAYPIVTANGVAASSFTVPTTGLYYVGISISATVVPTMQGSGTTGTMVTIPGLTAPILDGSAATQATPPAYPFNAGAITAANNSIPYFFLY